MTLLEWLENNRSTLKDGVYEVTGLGNICHNDRLINDDGCEVTNDSYKVENGVIHLLEDISNQIQNVLDKRMETKTASDYLNEAANLLSERGKQYDKSGQERSMEKIVKIFNIQTGRNLTTVEGWYFMQVLKDVRFFQNTEKPHEDSLLDGISYRGLMTEEALKDVR